MTESADTVKLSTIFGMNFSCLSEEQISDLVLTHPRTPQDGVGLIITPNIQHIALLQDNLPLKHACQNADILTYDGFPLVLYAKLRGQPVSERTTGRGIVEHIFSHPEKLHTHKIFLILDSQKTSAAAMSWAKNKNLGTNFECVVPPYGFENNIEYSQNLLTRIREFGTTILLMGVGAPKSEIFIDQHRTELPPCWALCIGQAVLVAMGLRPSPPKAIQTLNLEWLWRILQEPKRLLGRYVKSGWAFLRAALKDIVRRA